MIINNINNLIDQTKTINEDRTDFFNYQKSCESLSKNMKKLFDVKKEDQEFNVFFDKNKGFIMVEFDVIGNIKYSSNWNKNIKEIVK